MWRDTSFYAYQRGRIDVDGPLAVDEKATGAPANRTGQSSGIRSVQEEQVSFSDTIALPGLPAPGPLEQTEFAACLHTSNAAFRSESDLQRGLGCPGLRHDARDVSHASKEDDGRVPGKAWLHGLYLLYRVA